MRHLLEQLTVQDVYALYERFELQLAACALELLPDLYRVNPEQSPQFLPDHNAIFAAILRKIIVRQHLLNGHNELESLTEREIYYNVEELLDEVGLVALADKWPKDLQLKHIYHLVKTTTHVLVHQASY